MIFMGVWEPIPRKVHFLEQSVLDSFTRLLKIYMTVLLGELTVADSYYSTFSSSKNREPLPSPHPFSITYDTQCNHKTK